MILRRRHACHADGPRRPRLRPAASPPRPEAAGRSDGGVRGEQAAGGGPPSLRLSQTRALASVIGRTATGRHRFRPGGAREPHRTRLARSPASLPRARADPSPRSVACALNVYRPPLRSSRSRIARRARPCPPFRTTEARERSTAPCGNGLGGLAGTYAPCRTARRDTLPTTKPMHSRARSRGSGPAPRLARPVRAAVPIVTGFQSARNMQRLGPLPRATPSRALNWLATQTSPRRPHFPIKIMAFAPVCASCLPATRISSSCFRAHSRSPVRLRHPRTTPCCKI